jgi:cell division septation protein DedD
MQSHTKVRALRLLGGLVAALAVVPWLGVGAAQASTGSDDSCATRPAGVPADATCSLLHGPNGIKVFGETWALRASDNHLLVWAFPDLPTGGAADSVQLCATSAGAYPAKHQCGAFDADNVFGGSSTIIDVALDAHEIAATAPVWWALSVQQGSSTAVATGGEGALPSQSPTSTSTSSPSTTPSHSHSPSTTATSTSTGTPTPSISGTTTATTSVSPTKTHASASTSVLGVKLAKTGGPGVGPALVLSVALLGLGGILVVGAQTVPAASRRRH